MNPDYNGGQLLALGIINALADGILQRQTLAATLAAPGEEAAVALALLRDFTSVADPKTECLPIVYALGRTGIAAMAAHFGDRATVEQWLSTQHHAVRQADRRQGIHHGPDGLTIQVAMAFSGEPWPAADQSEDDRAADLDHRETLVTRDLNRWVRPQHAGTDMHELLISQAWFAALMTGYAVQFDAARMRAYLLDYSALLIARTGGIRH